MDIANLTKALTTAKGKLALGLGAALLVIVLCLASAWGGYRHGYGTAKAAGDAKYTALQKAQADAWAESKAKTLDRFVLAAQKADALATEHRAATKRLETARNDIVKEIPHATTGLDACAFGPDFLRVYNAALGLGSSGVPAAAGAGGAAGSANATAAADAGVRNGAPVKATPADMLTHLADYGKWCWDTADQRDKLLRLLDEEAR